MGYFNEKNINHSTTLVLETFWSLSCRFQIRQKKFLGALPNLLPTPPATTLEFLQNVYFMRGFDMLILCKNIEMAKPHTKLTFRQISSVVAGVVGGGRLGSAPRKIRVSNFETTGKTPKSFLNKRCRVINIFFIELTQVDSPFSIRRPKA